MVCLGLAKRTVLRLRCCPGRNVSSLCSSLSQSSRATSPYVSIYLTWTITNFKQSILTQVLNSLSNLLFVFSTTPVIQPGIWSYDNQVKSPILTSTSLPQGECESRGFSINRSWNLAVCLQFVSDGIFKAELNEFLTRELAEDGYSGVEVRVTPSRTEIIILATR